MALAWASLIPLKCVAILLDLTRRTDVLPSVKPRYESASTGGSTTVCRSNLSEF